MARNPTLATLAAAVLLMAAGPAPTPAGGTPVALRAQPGTELDRVARRLVAQDLAEARDAGETPLVLAGVASLGEAGKQQAIFVQLQSPRECGSAGCSTSAFVREGRDWRKVLDAVSGPVRVDAVRHRGVRDLVVHGRDRWIWNGAAFVDSRPAPAVDLRMNLAWR